MSAKKPPERRSAYAEKIEEQTKKLEDTLKVIDSVKNDNNKLKSIKISQIKSPKFHDRTAPSRASILELSKNISEIGLQQPIIVRKLEDDSFERIIGYRRIEAMKILEHSEIPAIILENITDSEAILMMISENLQRENLNIYDETVALLEYIAVTLNKKQHEVKSFLFKIKNFYGSKIKNLTKTEKEEHDVINNILLRTGKFSIQTFINRLRVLNLNQIIIDAMRNNLITYSIAIELQKLKDQNIIEHLINEIVKNGMTTKELTIRVGQLNGGDDRLRVSQLTSFKKVLNQVQYNKLSSEKKEELQKLFEQIKSILTIS